MEEKTNNTIFRKPLNTMRLWVTLIDTVLPGHKTHTTSPMLQWQITNTKPFKIESCDNG